MTVMAKQSGKKTASGAEPDDEWITRSIRFPPELYARVEADAKKARRSTQLQFIWMLEELYRLQAAEGAG
ncbi:hypothetical protein [Gemmata sp.]|uniref:hypothetical protein n=1 Tax=Gemmata sp. TaxID=1914242 RepID=UPI003F6F7956